jgi:hypothetical protein
MVESKILLQALKGSPVMAEDLRSALHLSNEYQLMKQINIILQYSYRHALFASDTHIKSPIVESASL